MMNEQSNQEASAKAPRIFKTPSGRATFVEFRDGWNWFIGQGGKSLCYRPDHPLVHEVEATHPIVGKLTQAKVKAELKLHGVSFRRIVESDEYEVGYFSGYSGYFTDSLSDALNTGIRIARRGLRDGGAK